MTELDRAIGTLLGQATGDALGTAVEFQTAAWIAHEYPEGPREIVGGGPFVLRPGQITDDTELALALARSLVRKADFDVQDVSDAYARWYRSGPFDCGATCATAFDGSSLASDMMARANRDSQANGALMRVSPLAIMGARRPAAWLAGAAAADARLSHPHPVCQGANRVFTLAISHAIRTGAGAVDVYELALAAARKDPAADPLYSWLELARAAPPTDMHQQMGWVRLALTNAFWQLLHAPSAEQGIIDTTRRGGDTDTNAAIAGALLGSVWGVGGSGGIPQRWSQIVLGCASPRPIEYHAGDLPELAEALLGAPG